VTLCVGLVVVTLAIWWSIHRDLAAVRRVIWQHPTPEYPRLVSGAFVAAEDPDFFEHSRFYTLDGVFQMLRGSTATRDASLTNQIVKNHVPIHRSVRRVWAEVLTSIILDASTSKEAILRAYLNCVYLGTTDRTQVIGVQAASQGYLHKSPTALTPYECARLAAAVRSPRRFSPIDDSASVIARRLTVLDRMYTARQLSREQLSEARRIARSAASK